MSKYSIEFTVITPKNMIKNGSNLTFCRCTHPRPEPLWRTAEAPVPGGWRGRWGCSWWELYRRDAAVSVRLTSDLQCQSHSSVETALHSTTPGLRSPTQQIHTHVIIICGYIAIGKHFLLLWFGQLLMQKNVLGSFNSSWFWHLIISDTNIANNKCW